MSAGPWPTAITDISKDRVAVRGHDIDELAQRCTFAEVLWLLFTGSFPDERLVRILDAILVLSIDHGPGSPSALTARTVSSAGALPWMAASTGLLAMATYHGSPAGPCLDLLRSIRSQAGGLDRRALDEAAASCVGQLGNEGRRFPGFGHRIHRQDRRVAYLLDLARDTGYDEYVPVAQAVGRALARDGHELPMNLDGAIATVLGPTELSPPLATAIFMVSRFAGLHAQAWEERERMKPMRVIEPRAWYYDGPGAEGDTV